MKTKFVIDRIIAEKFSEAMVHHCQHDAERFPSCRKYFDNLSDFYADLPSTLELLDETTERLLK